MCVLPVWLPKVDVDLRPSAGWVRIGAQQISLQDIKARISATNPTASEGYNIQTSSARSATYVVGDGSQTGS